MSFCRYLTSDADTNGFDECVGPLSPVEGRISDDKATYRYQPVFMSALAMRS